jgi:hypothetical protein
MSMPAGLLRAAGKLNVPVYRLTRGRVMGKIGRAPVLLLTSIGRRSGQPRTAPVLFLAEVQIKGERRLVRARVAEGEERAELWRKMNEQYAGFEDYDERTSRDIAVFVLDPR